MKRLLLNAILILTLAALAAPACSTADPQCVDNWNFAQLLGTLGTSATYAASPFGPSITAYGFTSAGAANLFGTANLGLGLASVANHEINNSAFIQLDLLNVIQDSSIQGFSLKLSAIDCNDVFKIYGSNTLGSVGTVLKSGGYSYNNFFFTVPNLGDYRYLTVKAYSGDVMLRAARAIDTDCEPPTGEVPEPGTMALAGTALLALGWLRRR